MKKVLETIFLVICFLLLVTCYLGLLFIGGLIEWSLIKESLWQFFNPFILILVIIQMLQMPITYILIAFGLFANWGINKLDKNKE